MARESLARGLCGKIVSFFAALAVLAWLAAAGTTVGIASMVDSSPCTTADALLDSGDLAGADAAYKEILATNATSPCAKAGDQAALDLRAAEVLDSHGLQASVTSLVLDAIKNRPQTPIPVTLVQGRSETDIVASLFEQGYVDAGNKALQQLLNDDPNVVLPLALSPQHRAQVSFDVAQALEHAGFHDQAMLVLQQTIASYPNVSPPPALSAQARAARGFQVANALEQAGFHDQAVAVLQQTISAYPQFTPPSTLNDVRQAHRSPWQSELWLDVQDAVVAVLVGLLVIVGASLLYRWIGQALRGGLVISSFQVPSGVSIDGAGFAAAVGDYIQGLGEHGQLPDRVTKWGDDVQLPTNLVGAVPQVNVIDGLLSMLARALPRRDVALGGVMHQSQSASVGVSAFLQDRDNRIKASQSFWAGHYGLPKAHTVPATDGATASEPSEALPGGLASLLRHLGAHTLPSEPTASALSTDRPESLYPLAFPVAVWAVWNMCKKNAPQLGTSDWESYAFFGIGADFDSAGDTDNAIRCYLEALARDHRNSPLEFGQSAYARC